MPGLSVTVAEQIASLRRVAGDRAAARIRRQPDAVIARIVEAWPRNFGAARAEKLGFKLVEHDLDDIIRFYIEDELAGRVS